MPEAFPSTPRAPTAVRLCAVAIGLAAVVLVTRTTVTSVAWVGRTFPGFFLLVNRVVPSIGLAHWSGFTVADLYQSQVTAVNGMPVMSTDQVYSLVASSPPGTSFRYRLRKAGVERDITVVSQTFTGRDWVFLFGAYLINGLVFVACGLVVWVLRPYSLPARGFLALGTALGAFFITAMDLYGPGTFARLHFVIEPLASAASFHITLVFPQLHRYARSRFYVYLPALLIALLYQVFLYHQRAFSTILMVDMIFLGSGAVFMALRLIAAYMSGASQLVRQRVRVVSLGTLFAFGIPGSVLLVSVLTWGGVAMNIAGFTPFLFAVSLAYAIVKHDLLEIDAMVKRGAYYLLLTGAVGAAYLGAIVIFNSLLRASAVTDSPIFPVLFTFVVLLVFNPLRTRLQAFVDRVFFRTRYDGAQVLAEVGAELSSALKRDQIVNLVLSCVDQAIPNAGTRLFGGRADRGDRGGIPPGLAALLADGRIITAFDPPERYPDPATHEAVRVALEEVAAEIAVPMLRRGELVGALTLGPKRSGLFYTAGDAEFLRALAHATATALQNAASYEELAALNAGLEQRVRERTSQLEAANQELEATNAELKTAQVQLVQSEKLASLGRLVAGVAHEINNPVSFIASSIAPLRRRLTQAAAKAPEAGRLLGEAEELVGIMARGAERTASIVKDLRSFSRLGEATRKTADLHEGLEVSLRLLESRWRDRIVVHRDFGDVPPIECDPGQLNQVFMNLLANAADAIPGQGNVWVATRADADHVTVTIRDDGGGIAPDILGRIFDPFFTTKDVGAGTGLGLAISHGVVTAHGGRIEVESQPGAGATFRVILPRGAAALSLDRAATGT